MTKKYTRYEIREFIDNDEALHTAGCWFPEDFSSSEAIEIIEQLLSENDELSNNSLQLKAKLDKVVSCRDKLWRLLDDIDTASDAFKPKKNNYYNYVIKIAEKRHTLLSTDGYELKEIRGE